MKNISDEPCLEKEDIYLKFSNFFRKSYSLWDNVEKYVGAGEATDDAIL
jgi:hypothetical protein